MKTSAQSSFTLTTVQPSRGGLLERLLGSGGVGELALVVVVQDEQAQGRLVGVLGEVAASAMSPFELPAASSGRRPVRLQMRTGFSGPSSR